MSRAKLHRPCPIGLAEEKRPQNRYFGSARWPEVSTPTAYCHSPTPTLLCSPVGPAMHALRFDSVVDRSAFNLARGRHRC
jgi:hypothetical protein